MRHADWQSRFWDELERQRPLPFQYGVRDCVLFGATVADAISMDGHYVERARTAFEWANETDAARLLARADLKELIESVMGKAIPWTRLQMGDFVLIVISGAGRLAVNDGVLPIAAGDGCLVPCTWDAALCGWSVD